MLAFYNPLEPEQINANGSNVSMENRSFDAGTSY